MSSSTDDPSNLLAPGAAADALECVNFRFVSSPPTVKDAKQIKDTIATIQALSAMGVPPKNIRLVFNRLEAKETVEDAFYPLIAFHEDTKSFTLRLKAAIEFSELYQRLQLLGTGIAELLADKTDYKPALRAEKSQEKKARLASMISARRLAASAQENLDEVFAVLTAVK